MSGIIQKKAAIEDCAPKRTPEISETLVEINDLHELGRPSDFAQASASANALARQYRGTSRVRLGLSLHPSALPVHPFPTAKCQRAGA
jgi:hypothetical protein